MKQDAPEPTNRRELAALLAEHLRDMVEQSCRSMAPLWLEDSRRARRGLEELATADLGFVPSDTVLRLGKSSRSKYRKFAAWRHAVLWRRTLDSVEAPYAKAVSDMYFTPFPADETPFAYSECASDAPAARDYPSVTAFVDGAKEGCFASLKVLLEDLSRVSRDAAPVGEQAKVDAVTERLLKSATSKSVEHVLKLDESHHLNRRSR